MKKMLMLTALALLTGAGAAAQNVVKDTTGFKTASSGNVAEMLRGQLSGVRVSSVDGNPVGALNVNIRGLNTLRSDNQPLWIVDGVMLSTDLNQNLDAFWQYDYLSYSSPLNPLAFLDANQIESIEVLKDVSATAIYGTKGANGVIIVKTKVDKSGPAVLNWSSNMGINVGNGVKGIGHNHYVAFSGEKNKTVYNISGNFRNSTGSVSRSGSNYGVLKANFDTKSNSVVWFGFNALFSAGKSSSPSAVNYVGSPTMTMAMRSADYAAITPVADWLSDYDDDTQDYRGLTSMYFQVNITPWLYAKIDAGLDYQHNTRVLWYGGKTPQGSSDPTVGIDGNINGGLAGNLTTQLFSYSGKAEVGVNRYFGEDHHLQAAVDFELTGNLNEFNTLNGYNFFTHELRGKGINVGAFPIQIHKFSNNYAHNAVFADFAYDFRKAAGVSAVFRWDSTPRYGAYEKHFFPSVEAYVDFRNLLFEDSEGCSMLRLEGGWGVSGLDKLIPYNQFGYVLTGSWPEPASGTSSFYDGVNRVKTTETHVSLKTAFASDRIRFGVTWFNRISEDNFLMYRLGAPVASGSETWKSAAAALEYSRRTDIRNSGWEFDLGADIIKGADWRWNLSLNFATNANRLAAVNADDRYGKNLNGALVANCNFIDNPVASLYGYRMNAAGDGFLDSNKDGVLDDADKFILGNTLPKIYGGLQTALSFKGVTLEVMLDGAAGQDIADLNSILLDGLTDSAGNLAVCAKNVVKGDYLRIGNLGLKYNVPVRTKCIKGLEARVSCTNIATFTKYGGWNPDVNCFGKTVLSNGIDYGSYPLYRTITVGISAKF